MVQVLTYKRQPSGTVGDVIHNSDGVLWTITRVYDAASGLYDWRQEKHDGVYLAIWGLSSPEDPDHPNHDFEFPNSGIGLHGFQSEHINMPVGYRWDYESYALSGSPLTTAWLESYYPEHIYDTQSPNSSISNNANDIGHIDSFFGVLKNVWNNREASVIPGNSAKSVEIPFSMIKEFASGNFSSRYGNLNLNGLYWDKYRRRYSVFTPSGQPNLNDYTYSIGSRATARPILEITHINEDKGTVTCQPKLVKSTDIQAKFNQTSSNGVFTARPSEAMPSATWTVSGISTISNPYDVSVIVSGKQYTGSYTATFVGGNPANHVSITFTEPVSGYAAVKYQRWE